MAILIPSKNIYDKNNPKIIDNIIDNINVNSTVISSDNRYNVGVHIEKYSQPSFNHAFTTDYEEWTNSATVNARNGSDNYVYYAGVAVGIRTHYANDINIYINRLIENSYISTLLTGYNKNGYANVNYSVVYKHYTGTSKITVIQYPLGGNNSDYVNNVNLTYEENYKTSEGDLPQLSVEKTVTYNPQNLISAIESTANAYQENETTLLNENIIKYFDENEFYCEIEKILCGVETYEASAADRMSNFSWGGDATSTTRDVVLTGTCEKYVPVEIKITFNGNTIGISLDDGSIEVGSGNKPYSLSGNELLQDSGTVGDKSISQHLGEKVLEQYATGKETAKLLCSISDYFDESGKKVIDTKTEKMSFELHDEVIPMVMGADGKDAYMSKKSNGNPKVFYVVGSNIIYDGAVWQELTLQEIAEGN